MSSVDQFGPRASLVWCLGRYVVGAYAAAHFMSFAFKGVLGLPVPFSMCLIIALIPMLNLGGCILAGTVLVWTYMLIFGLKAVSWLLEQISAGLA